MDTAYFWIYHHHYHLWRRVDIPFMGCFFSVKLEPTQKCAILEGPQFTTRESVHQNGTRIAHRFHSKPWEMSVYVSFIHDKWWWMMMNAIEIKEHLLFVLFDLVSHCAFFWLWMFFCDLIAGHSRTHPSWLTSTYPTWRTSKNTMSVILPIISYHIHPWSPISIDIPLKIYWENDDTMTSEPPELHLSNPTVCRLVMSPSWMNIGWTDFPKMVVLDGCERVWTWGYYLPPKKGHFNGTHDHKPQKEW